MKTVEDFIEKHYPNYHGCDQIARLNDLYKLCDGEFEEGDPSDTILRQEFGGKIDFAYPIIKRELKLLEYRVLRLAVKNYIDEGK